MNWEFIDVEIKYFPEECINAKCEIYSKVSTTAIERINISYENITIDLLNNIDDNSWKLCGDNVISFTFHRSFLDPFYISFSNQVDLQKFTSSLRNRVKFRTINAKQFYGNQSNDNNIKPLKVVDQDSLDKNENVFEIFTKQDFAFHYYDKLPSQQRAQCKLFTYESIQLGKRHFLVSDVAAFCEEYLNLNNSYNRPVSSSSSSASVPRHVYEIIRESFPCRLYFDVEYLFLPENTCLQGNECLHYWLYLVIWKLYECFGVEVSWEHIVVLDSSTKEKFSKHVNFLISAPPSSSLESDEIQRKKSRRNTTFFTSEEEPAASQQKQQQEWLFRNNQEILIFIQTILYDISTPLTEEESPLNNNAPNLPPMALQLNGQFRIPRPEYELFWVHTTTPNKRSFFIDLGVYTRNRAFRLYKSCKFGKEKVLSIHLEDKKRYTHLQKLTSMISSAHTNNKKDQLNNSLQKKLFEIQKTILFDTFIIPYDLFSPITTAIHSSVTCNKADDDSQLCNDEVVNNSAILSPSKKKNMSQFKMFADRSSEFNTTLYALLPSMISALNPSDTNNNVRPFQLRMNLLQNNLLLHKNHYPQLGSNSSYSMTGGLGSNWRQQAIANSSYPQEASWFPKLDAFVKCCRFNTQGGIAGVLHQWTMFKQTNGSFPVFKLRYQVLQNRYCAKIERSHKSNGIYFEVNLMNREIVQKCWDIDCRGFESQPLIVPEECVPSIEELLLLVAEYEFQKK